MSDISVTVMVDGKTVFAHGISGTSDPLGAAAAGLGLAMNHFASVRMPLNAAAANGEKAAANVMPLPPKL